ncbi:YihY family inner membrane protein [Silvimonas sp. JCM 19000]
MFHPLTRQHLESLVTISFWRRVIGFGQYVGHRLIKDRCLQTAGSLTYTTLLALIPLFTIALTLFSAFPMFSDYSAKFKTFILLNLVPDAAGKIIGVYMRQFSDNAEKLTALGTIGLAVTALLLIFTIEKTFNEIWSVRRPRGILARTLIYWAALTLGPVALGISLSLTSWIYHHSGGLISGIQVWDTTIRVGPSLVMFAMLSLMYITIPNCYVPRSHAIIAGVLVGVALELMKALFGLYVQAFVTLKMVYGAFASFPIFLTWLYVCWVIILGGAVLSASLSYWHGDAWEWHARRGTRFEQAVRILLALSEAHENGVLLHINELRLQINVGLDSTLTLLDEMLECGWVETTREGEWLLAAAPARITLLDIYECVEAPLAAKEGKHMEELAARMRAPLQETLADYARLEAIASAEQPA